MDRVGNAVGRELGRFGPASGMAPVVEAWPLAVGPEIARNAWPARIARDGTLHVHTQDSIWAFELTTRAEEIRTRLGNAAPVMAHNTVLALDQAGDALDKFQLSVKVWAAESH